MDGEEQKVQFSFTEEELKHLRLWRLAWSPLRIVLGLTLFSLVSGGFGRFFAAPPSRVFTVLFIVMVIVERLVQYPDLGGQRKDRGSVVALWCGFGLSYILAMIEYFHFPESWHLLRWNMWYVLAGGLFFACGQLLRVVAIRTLGRFFTVSVRVHEGHRVIKDGVYRRVRHPAYTGLWLIAFGFTLLFASAVGLLFFFTFGTGALLYRIRVEEGALVQQFGEEYVQYMKKTKRLVPFLI
ncbi:MAG: isoprenylcysteine carboxylmethyltransferase family protein [Deltaproteobacteria bacterium]|nr:MAG: isoprenylcysteine carboxylmethyltransferase family protein [Deltaproteobacteria bacterium]